MPASNLKALLYALLIEVLLISCGGGGGQPKNIYTPGETALDFSLTTINSLHDYEQFTITVNPLNLQEGETAELSLIDQEQHLLFSKIEKLNLIDEKISLDGKKVILVPFFLVFPIFFKGFIEFPSLNLISYSFPSL